MLLVSFVWQQMLFFSKARNKCLTLKAIYIVGKNMFVFCVEGASSVQENQYNVLLKIFLKIGSNFSFLLVIYS